MKKETKRKGNSGPPVVAILGHVDHGKTSLLDKIRNTNVAAREAGGITQNIDISSVTTNQGKKVTFIDTPGHAAFSQMRSLGAKVADLAVLVVAADDGVKPQTKEALSYIKEVKIPFIVVASKIDLPASDVKKVKSQLEKEKVVFEGSGGDVPLISVSAKTGKGIEELLEMITLVSEVQGIEGDASGTLEAVVLETGKDKRGMFVVVVVRRGILRVGSEIVSDGVECRVRGLFDAKGEVVKETKRGEAALVLGFSNLPPVGAKVRTKDQENFEKPKVQEARATRKVEEGEIPVLIKAENTGSLQAIISNLPEKVVVTASGVGNVSEGDIFFAKSVNNSRIFVFKSKVPSSVSKLAETEGVSIETFDVIYKFLERLEELLKKSEKNIMGEAKILASFPYNNKRVAGCKVAEGRIARGDTILIMRKSKELGNTKAASLRKEKTDVVVVKKDEEFGIIFDPQLDFKIGDMILSVKK